jgi:molybdopterin converting factor small subunit
MTRILFFGRVRDIVGRTELICDLPMSIETITDLRAWLSQTDPLLGEALRSPGVRVAVDQVFCISEAVTAQAASEIAFMSPLSGG